MLYRRGEAWWYKFKFAGRVFRESAKTNSKDLARRVELKRRRDLEEGYHGLRKRHAPQIVKQASEEWLEFKRPTLAPKSYLIEKTNLGHLLPVLGQKLLTDIRPDDQPLPTAPHQGKGITKNGQPRDRDAEGHSPEAAAVGKPSA